MEARDGGEATGVEVPWRPVSLRFEEPVQEVDEMEFWVIDSPQQLERTFGARPLSPGIDFGRELLVVAHRGFCPTGGYGIRVTSVTVAGSEVRVAMQLQDPPPGAMVIMIITYPRAELVIARKALPAGPVEFAFFDHTGKELGRVAYFSAGAGKLG